MPVERRPLPEQSRTEVGGYVEPPTRPSSVPPAERRVQIAAAKARVTLDQRRGLETPEWILALSREIPATRRTTSSRDRRVQIAAAKARVTLDRRLYVETPQWIIDLANEKVR